MGSDYGCDRDECNHMPSQGGESKSFETRWETSLRDEQELRKRSNYKTTVRLLL
jgi:hypothetical protein